MLSDPEITGAVKKIKATNNLEELEQIKLSYLGRKGALSLALRGLKDLPPAQRQAEGQRLNAAKTELTNLIARRLKFAEHNQDMRQTAAFLDLTAPGKGPKSGHLHPVQELQRELIQAFWQIGFNVARGPEIETDWYNFEALNIPPSHPARDMQDTFYLENGAVPRTHTSSVQIRYMEKNKPPIRIIAPGKVYRNEDEDTTHIWSFNQIEGLAVDRGITLGDLKGTLLFMLKALFGEEAELRLRPNYFPYTEPSVEMDGRPNKNSPWLELGGAGMVHPRVLRNVNIDPAVYSGFAFGFGLERMASIKYGVDDLRHFWRPDLRFSEQF